MMFWTGLLIGILATLLAIYVLPWLIGFLLWLLTTKHPLKDLEDAIDHPRRH